MLHVELKLHNHRCNSSRRSSIISRWWCTHLWIFLGKRVKTWASPLVMHDVWISHTSTESLMIEWWDFDQYVLKHLVESQGRAYVHCKYFCCNSYDFLLYLIPRCTEDVLLTTKCCIQQIAVLWLKYVLFAVVFTSVSPIWQINVVELKYIKSVIKSTAD